MGEYSEEVERDLKSVWAKLTERRSPVSESPTPPPLKRSPSRPLAHPRGCPKSLKNKNIETKKCLRC